MTGSIVERSLQALELLSREGGGAQLNVVADHIGIPKSVAHRLLGELVRLGYVAQEPESHKYALAAKLVSLGFRYLATSGVADLAQPILDRLADESKELVRLAVVGSSTITWVAKAQGARWGLLYDPEMGQPIQLYCTASGHAWLSTFSDEAAVELMMAQGLGKPGDRGPRAPTTIAGFLKKIKEARTRGYAVVIDSGALGTSAVAVPIVHRADGKAIGTISIAGPTARLTPDKLDGFVGFLNAAAADLADLSQASGYFRQSPDVSLGTSEKATDAVEAGPLRQA